MFTEPSQIKKPYEVVGIISCDNPDKYRILTLGDAIESLKEKAREVVANAIIIDKSQPVKSGIISTGIYVEARAIRLKRIVRRRGLAAGGAHQDQAETGKSNIEASRVRGALVSKNGNS